MVVSYLKKTVKYLDIQNSIVCNIMVICVFGEPEFIFKALAVCNLTFQFLIEQCNPLTQALVEVKNAKLLTIITDGHCINQNFFNSLKSDVHEDFGVVLMVQFWLLNTVVPQDMNLFHSGTVFVR